MKTIYSELSYIFYSGILKILLHAHLYQPLPQGHPGKYM